MRKFKDNKALYITITACSLMVLAVLIGKSLSFHQRNIEPLKENNTQIKKLPMELNYIVPNVPFLSSDTKIQSQLRYYDYRKYFVDNIHFSFKDKSISLRHPIFVYCNRYYLPVGDIIKSIGGSTSKAQNKFFLKLNRNTAALDAGNNVALLNNKNIHLRNSLMTINNTMYISLIDFTSLFNMVTSWNYDTKTISLYYNRYTPQRHVFNVSGKLAFIRLEDISVDERYGSSDGLQKLRLVGDFLYSGGVPFHLGWVPRYVNPLYKIDNDLSKNYSIYNADFLYTLDYLIGRGALIGLHGYTHQNGNLQSIIGVEFDKEHNNTPELIRQRLTAAIECAKILNIPINFFETPHYEADYLEHIVMEKYFNIIYEPFDAEHQNNIYIRKVNHRMVRYIPTPLDYVHGSIDTDNMIHKINSLGSNQIGSFFYHPSIEFPYIKLVKKAGTNYPYFVYPDNTPLNRILDTFKKDGYIFEKITDQ